jgi:hypothetical protein
MGIEIRLPQINSDTDKGQLAQIKSYLYQLTEQLNWALGNLESQRYDYAVAKSLEGTASSNEEEGAQNTFDKVKGLIIKSADIVNSYYESISKKLVGEYSALSDYGSFKQNTEAKLSATSKELEALFTHVEEVDADNNDIKYTMIHSANAWVKVGVLEYENGSPVYGMEIGQTNEETNEEGASEIVYTAFSRYTSNGVYLYDNNGTEVAWINNSTLHITNAEITTSLKLGKYMVDLTDGVAFKYVGGV